MSAQPHYPQVNPRIVLREEFDDWAILFDPDNGASCGLNPVGVLVWKQMDGQHSLDAILGHLREHCDAVPENTQDIEKFVEKLQKTGFLVAAV